MTLLDRVRIERAVYAYDFWLDLRGAPARRRRELRRELRANLVEASAHRGSRTAVRSLGSTRQMAADAGVVDRSRPRWAAGLSAAAAALGLVLLLELLAALSWVDGAMAAARGSATSGSLTFFPGSSVEYAPLGAGFSVAVEPGWLCLAAGLATLVVVARPWRPLTARGRVG
jgi:hypothetical protein